METKSQKKKDIRNQIVSAAQNYYSYLTNRVFLYVFGDEFIEVMYRIDDFLHLTGVETFLGAKSFYQLAKKSQLGESQFFFKPKHPYDVVKKKLPRLICLNSLTNQQVTILQNMNAGQVSYKIGLTNCDFTVGMYEKCGFYSPQTLRVKDKAIENSEKSQKVDFIFSRQTSFDKEKLLPQNLKQMIEETLLIQLFGEEQENQPQKEAE